MSAKTNRPKAKTSKAAAKTAPKATKTVKPSKAKATAKPPAASRAVRAFYFVAGDYEPRITNKKPKPNTKVLEFATFEEARDQAVEQLIDLIDRCERRLWDVKRAEDFEHYRRLDDDA